MESFVGEWPDLERGWVYLVQLLSLRLLLCVSFFTNVLIISYSLDLINSCGSRTVIPVCLLPAEGPVGEGVEFILFYGEGQYSHFLIGETEA